MTKFTRKVFILTDVHVNLSSLKYDIVILTLRPLRVKIAMYGGGGGRGK